MSLTTAIANNVATAIPTIQVHASQARTGNDTADYIIAIGGCAFAMTASAYALYSLRRGNDPK
ncbi:Uncharacterised protein [uncultured archaeon]|nr:Uncharacterised protein [uncultured archaeon]